MSKTRLQRIEAVQAKAQEAIDEIDALTEEMQSGLDNMPLNIQEGERGQAIQERIDTLTGWSDSLQDIVDEVM